MQWGSAYYMHGQRDRDGELGCDTTRHFSPDGLGLNSVPFSGLGLSLQQTLGHVHQTASFYLISMPVIISSSSHGSLTDYLLCALYTSHLTHRTISGAKY